MSGKRKHRERVAARRFVQVYYDIRTDEVVLPSGRMPAEKYKAARAAHPELNLPAPNEITHYDFN